MWAIRNGSISPYIPIGPLLIIEADRKIPVIKKSINFSFFKPLIKNNIAPKAKT